MSQLVGLGGQWLRATGSDVRQTLFQMPALPLST